MTAPLIHARLRTSAFPSGRRPWAAAVALGATTGLIALALPTGTAAAATFVDLGTARNFSVLAGSAVTNTGPSVLARNLGVSPGSTAGDFSGAPSGTVQGEIHLADGVALQAQTDLTDAYNTARDQPRDTTATALRELGGGQTFLPGVHGSDSSLGLTGTVTLDAQGDPNAVFIFQAGSTLTTAAGSEVLLSNGASACNVFWQVGSSADFGANSDFAGTVLAFTSITLITGADVVGRLLARSAEVTLQDNQITDPCAAAVTQPDPEPEPEPVVVPPTTTPTTTPTTSPTPAPTTSPTTSPTPAPTTTPTTDPTPAPTTAPIAAPVPAPTADPTPTTPPAGPVDDSGTPATTGTPTGTTTGRTTTTGRVTGGPATTGQRLTGGPGITGGPIVPRGAPETGGGGTAPADAPPLLAAGLLALLTAAGIVGLSGPPPAPARHRSS